MSGIFFTREDLNNLSLSTRNEIISYILGEQDIYSDSSDGPIDLSSIQAEKLVRGLSYKTRQVLRSIIDSKEGEKGFWGKELAKSLDIELSDLTGVWSGLTRRVRTVSESSEAYLIAWAWDEEKDDHFGHLHPVTYRNCKKAMNL